MPERGKIHSPQLAAQLRDFSGLRYGTITPTDLDGFLDFGNRLFVFIEAKLQGVQLPTGQRLALERLVDATASTSRHTLGIICEHTNRSGVIDLANSLVVSIRWKGTWRSLSTPFTVRQVIDHTLKSCALNHYLRRA